MESHPIEVDTLIQHDRPLSWSTSEELERIGKIADIGTLVETLDVVTRKFQNPLTRVFSSFHGSLRGALSLANMKHSVTAIAFSDSAFIATDYAFEAVNIGVSLVQSLLLQRVPVRVGIAHGSFAALRLKSDIGVDGGDHASQFLGTAVVRAHAAETCGVKGI